MTCPEREQDLLLLAHGALPWVQTFRTHLHLRGCPVCQSRLSRLTQVSARLAAEVRGPEMPPWSHSQAIARTSSLPFSLSSSWHIALVLLALSLVLGLGIGLSGRLTAPSSRSVSSPSVPASGGCRPDLPSSRCR